MYPYIVKWAITNKCNLRCKHCFRSEICNTVSKEDALFLIEDMAKHKVVCVALTGGEPMMADNFWYIIENLCQKKMRIAIATNGTLLDEETVERLISCKILNYQISLEGVTEEANDYVRGRGAFAKTLNGIRLLKRHNACVTMAVTLTHKNYDKIEDFIRFKNDNRIDYIRFELYIPVNKDEYNLSLTNEEISYIAQFAKYHSNTQGVEFPKFANCSCGAGETMLLINSDLSVSPCDLLCDEIRSKGRISKEKPLIDIINNDEAFVWWRNQEFKGCGASLIKNKTTKDIFEEVYMDVGNS